MTAADISAQPGAGWDEAQCAGALAKLEQLQAQLDELRLAIPRIIEPFHRPPTPTTFKLYAQGVVSSQNDIKTLSELWKHAEAQRTFEHVKQSLAANADLVASASIPSHGWVQRAQRDRESQKRNASETVEADATLTAEEISRILVDAQKNYPNINLEAQDANHSISARFVSGANLLKFRVNVEREANSQHKLNTECLGTTEPFLAITRCIASRPQTNDLKYLLDMIAAYKTVKATSCAKCGKLLDDAMLTPAARRSKQIAGSNETLETVWEPLHEGCLG